MRVRRWAYGLVRPVVRPIMRRLRMFFVGHLHDEIAQLRTEMAGLRAAVERTSVEREAATATRVQAAMADALATLALDRERHPRE